MLSLGIDPGLDGAVVAIDRERKVHLWDMPTLELGGKTASGKPSTKRAIDLTALSQVLWNAKGLAVAGEQVLCILEKVHAMPDQGVSSMFSMGEGFGVLKGMLTVYQVPFQLVPPQTWKKGVLEGTNKDKKAAIIWAQARYPGAKLVPPGCRTPSTGRADALCMAHFGGLAFDYPRGNPIHC